MSAIQARSAEAVEAADSDEPVVPQEPVELSQCYENFSDSVNSDVDKSVEESGKCIDKAEAKRTALLEDSKEKDKLELKVEALKTKLDGCSDMEVNEYFACHDGHVSTLEFLINTFFQIFCSCFIVRRL